MSASDLIFTERGPQAPDAAAVLDAVVAAWKSALGDNLNPNPATPQGQIMASQAACIEDKNAQLLFLANMFDPQQAEGVWQEALARIYFLERNPARPTLVDVRCVGLPGTRIRGLNESPATAPNAPNANATDLEPARLRIAGKDFVCVNSGEIGPDGEATITFQAEESGPLDIPANSEIRIIRAVPGWDSAENPAAGISGQSVESRAAFEARRYQSVARNARSVGGAVYARVAELPGVIDCVVRQNRGNLPIVLDGVPLGGHSIYVGVEGGDDGQIAQAIYMSLSAGCDYNGDTAVEVVDPVSGAKETVRFTRLTPTRVAVVVTLRANASMVSDVVERIQTGLVEDFYGERVSPCGQQSLRVRAGEDLYASRFYPVILDAGVTQLRSVELALVPGDGPVVDVNKEPLPTLSWQDMIHIHIDKAPRLAKEDVIVKILD